MPFQTLQHRLPAHSIGTSRELVSHHFGARKNARKTYMQASLHADEVPAMLVAHHLRGLLAELHEAGKIPGEIVLVPAANPIGLAQVVHGAAFGRFDLASGVNFNRDYQNLIPRLKIALEGKLGADAALNMRAVRTAAAAILGETDVSCETVALKNILQTLAHDADIVLDLHCDNQAVMHLYTATHTAQTVMPLARLLGAHAVLVAHESGGDPFDEAMGRPWKELADHFGAAYPLGEPALSVTVELRGETEVDHALAKRDAEAIIGFLAHCGHIDMPPPALPEALCAPTPLEGVQRVDAPHPGVVVFLKKPGDKVKTGDALVDLVNPVTGDTTMLHAKVDGVFFATVARRYAQAGMSLAKVAGPVAFRSGKLLGA